MALIRYGNENTQRELTRTLSPIGVWGLSFGCVIGYGAFSMPGSTFLPMAGPEGTAIALCIGAALILVIAANYRFLCKRYPDSGGSFAFTRNLFGDDHAFLCAWALVLAYVSLIWANATAFVHIGRYIFGPVLQVGVHYQVAGYDIYMGEVAGTLLVLLAFAVMACGPKRLLNSVNTAFAFVLLIGAIACFVAVMCSGNANFQAFDPGFAPDSAPGLEVLGIVALVPWVFMGFETASHAAGECKFPARKLGGLMAAAVLAGLAVYIMMAVAAVAGTPSEYGSWTAYIADLDNLESVASLPTLNAAAALGPAGTGLLAFVIVAALSTSMLGFFRATSRLMYCMALDGILPPWLAYLNGNHVPSHAILFVTAISALVPFVGRAAIGWATDTSAISAAIVYGYTSACSLHIARTEKRRGILATSIVGLAIAVLFLALPLVPNLWSVSALPAESYMILAAWSIFGLLFFRSVFKYDSSGRFGKSPIVWVTMLFLVLFTSTMWVRQVADTATQQTVTELSAYYAEEFQAQGVALDPSSERREEARLQSEADTVQNTLVNSSLFQMGLIAVSLVVLFAIYNLMIKRQREQEERRILAESASKAKTDLLSNMSHDIRTPMNAIVGYAHLARREGVSPEDMQRYLQKIDVSSEYLLALINDILEMSRIESGKLELNPSPTDLHAIMANLRDVFATQMEEKGIAFRIDCSNLDNAAVVCDSNLMNRVLLNLVGNAYKFTPEGGSVTVSLVQLGQADENGVARYELRVSDDGIGMSQEFAGRIFEAFERERTSTVSGIEGTGLGMAITKSIVDLMAGTIDVETAPGEGTTFTILLDFPVPDEDGQAEPEADAGGDDAPADFSGKRILIAEDNEINCEIATIVLEDMGFAVDSVENGELAVKAIEESQPGYYDVILTDIQMPVLGGLEAARRIRALDDPALASIPIVAASANVFAEDVQASLDAGMNAHVGKPLDVPTLARTLSEVLKA